MLAFTAPSSSKGSVPAVPELDPEYRRVVVQYTSPDTALGFKLAGRRRGGFYVVRVTDVTFGSVAQKQGLVEGDIVDIINTESVAGLGVKEVGKRIKHYKSSRKGVFKMLFKRAAGKGPSRVDYTGAPMRGGLPSVNERDPYGGGSISPSGRNSPSAGATHRPPSFRASAPPLPPPTLEEKRRREADERNLPPPPSFEELPSGAAPPRAFEEQRHMRRPTFDAAPPPAFDEAPPPMFGDGASSLLLPPPPDFVGNGGGLPPPGFGGGEPSSPRPQREQRRQRSGKKSKDRSSRRSRGSKDRSGTSSSRRERNGVEQQRKSRSKSKGKRKASLSRRSRRNSNSSEEEEEKAVSSSSGRGGQRMRGVVRGAMTLHHHQVIESSISAAHNKVRSSVQKDMTEMGEAFAKALLSTEEKQAESSAQLREAFQQSVEMLQVMQRGQGAEEQRASELTAQIVALKADLEAARNQSRAQLKTTLRMEATVEERNTKRVAFARSAHLREQQQVWTSSRLPLLGFELKPPTPNQIDLPDIAWRCVIPGRRGTVHDGAAYTVRMIFDEMYPETPPRCSFIPPLTSHPNVNPADGAIQHPMLDRSGWLPAGFTIVDIAVNIQQLLHCCHLEGAINMRSASLFAHDPHVMKSKLRAEAVQRKRTVRSALSEAAPQEAAREAGRIAALRTGGPEWSGRQPKIVVWEGLLPMTTSADLQRLHRDALM